jgi:basic membrane lipoprotein Med (substrate-binding protein (PBP1-ABC) superfamily)
MTVAPARLLALLLAIAPAPLLGVGGCEQRTAETGSEQGKPTLKVALLHPGPISDGSWNAGAYEGLQKIEKELGAKVSSMQTSTPDEFEQGFRDYAQQGYDLVFGHGFEFQDAALEVGRDFPKTAFVVSSGSVEAANVASLKYQLGQATYLAGMLAASLSKSKRGGCVGGIRLPVIQETFNGFFAGTKVAVPEFEVSTAYTGNFEDVAAAKAATDALIAQGADVVLQNADAAGLGVIQSAQAHGVYAIGTNSDQNGIAPDTVLASAVISIPDSFLSVAQEVATGRFRGRIIEQGLASGVVSLVINPKLADRVPEDLRNRLTAAQEEIENATWKVAP